MSTAAALSGLAKGGATRWAVHGLSQEEALEAVERKGWDRVRWGDAGFTLLHYAARKGRDDLVAHLLGLGALDAEDSKNTTALGYAQRAGHSSIIALLEPATAPRQVASLLFTAAETYRGRVGGFLAVEHFL